MGAAALGELSQRFRDHWRRYKSREGTALPDMLSPAVVHRRWYHSPRSTSRRVEYDHENRAADTGDCGNCAPIVEYRRSDTRFFAPDDAGEIAVRHFIDAD